MIWYKIVIPHQRQVFWGAGVGVVVARRGGNFRLSVGTRGRPDGSGSGIPYDSLVGPLIEGDGGGNGPFSQGEVQGSAAVPQGKMSFVPVKEKP